MTLLDKEEQALSKSIEKGEWKSVADLEEERKKSKEYAKATFAKNQRLYIYLQQKDVAKTVELTDGVNIDLDERGKLIGIEIIDATQEYSLSDIEIIDATQEYSLSDIFNLSTENLVLDEKDLRRETTDQRPVG
jgi:uncharacterized protein YuzE